MTPEQDLQTQRAAMQRVVHDVNNALAPVLGFVELLLEDDGLLEDTEKVKRYLGLMRSGAIDALTTVASLRVFYGREP